MKATGPLSQMAIDSLRGRFAGQVIAPGDPGYEQARLVWNAIADKRPALVVRCSSVEDVVMALSFARDHDLLVAVRGGGHSIPGFSTCNGGIVIDLSLMRTVTVDPERRTARVEGGALLRQLDEAAQQFGLACPVGVVGHTGVAGLTLGGGIGRLQRKYGLTIDNLLACEMVGADCQLLRANQNENPELFWGLRGAGANFGVVTSFEFQLNPAGPGVMRGLLLYPLSRAREVAAIYREFTAQAPDELFITLAFGQPGALASSEGLAVFIGVMHCGPAADAERDLKALRATRPLADTIQPMTYLATQSALDEEAAWGVRSYGKGGFMPGLPDEAVAAMVEQISTAPGGGCGITLWAMGGAISRLPTEATAFSGRDAAFWIGVEASWVDATLDAAHRDWCRGAMAALQPFTGAGRYVNDVVETGADVVRAIYGPAKYERLVALKRRYDPENVFKLNQNIEP